MSWLYQKFPVFRREGEGERNNQLSEVYSVQFHMSNFRGGGQLPKMFLPLLLFHAHTHESCTTVHVQTATKKKKDAFVLLCVNITPASRKKVVFFSFDDLFPF